MPDGDESRGTLAWGEAVGWKVRGATPMVRGALATDDGSCVGGATLGCAMGCERTAADDVMA
jgi:hypothetical protein